MTNDEFLEQALLDDKFRPMPGHVICMKNTKNVEIDVAGLGTVTASKVTDSGLVLVSSDSKESEQVKALMVTVVAIGKDPDKWETRIPKSKKKENWNTTWDEQKIRVGTILSIRVGSGIDQTRGSNFIDLRYDEISCIGQPKDEKCPDMLPAPGWVLVRLEPVEAPDHAGLVVEEGLDDLLVNGHMLYGEIIGLPRGYNRDLRVGDRICFPAHSGVGATEFVEFDGNLRALPIQDVFGVVEDEIIHDEGEEPEDDIDPWCTERDEVFFNSIDDDDWDGEYFDEYEDEEE